MPRDSKQTPPPAKTRSVRSSTRRDTEAVTQRVQEREQRQQQALAAYIQRRQQPGSSSRAHIEDVEDDDEMPASATLTVKVSTKKIPRVNRPPPSFEITLEQREKMDRLRDWLKLHGTCASIKEAILDCEGLQIEIDTDGKDKHQLIHDVIAYLEEECRCYGHINCVADTTGLAFVYTYEKIVAEELRNGVMHYRTRYAGYPMERDVWLTSEAFMGNEIYIKWRERRLVVYIFKHLRDHCAHSTDIATKKSTPEVLQTVAKLMAGLRAAFPIDEDNALHQMIHSVIDELDTGALPPTPIMGAYESIPGYGEVGAKGKGRLRSRHHLNFGSEVKQWVKDVESAVNKTLHRLDELLADFDNPQLNEIKGLVEDIQHATDRQPLDEKEEGGAPSSSTKAGGEGGAERARSLLPDPRPLKKPVAGEVEQMDETRDADGEHSQPPQQSPQKIIIDEEEQIEPSTTTQLATGSQGGDGEEENSTAVKDAENSKPAPTEDSGDGLEMDVNNELDQSQAHHTPASAAPIDDTEGIRGMEDEESETDDGNTAASATRTLTPHQRFNNSLESQSSSTKTKGKAKGSEKATAPQQSPRIIVVPPQHQQPQVEPKRKRAPAKKATQKKVAFKPPKPKAMLTRDTAKKASIPHPSYTPSDARRSTYDLVPLRSWIEPKANELLPPAVKGKTLKKLEWYWSYGPRLEWMTKLKEDLNKLIAGKEAFGSDVGASTMGEIIRFKQTNNSEMMVVAKESHGQQVDLSVDQVRIYPI